MYNTLLVVFFALLGVAALSYAGYMLYKKKEHFGPKGGPKGPKGGPKGPKGPKGGWGGGGWGRWNRGPRPAWWWNGGNPYDYQQVYVVDRPSEWIMIGKAFNQDEMFDLYVRDGLYRVQSKRTGESFILPYENIFNGQKIVIGNRTKEFNTELYT